MSHFSRFKTSIKNLSLLSKTLVDLSLDYKFKTVLLTDSHGNKQNVDLVIFDQKYSSAPFGFSWDGYQYNIVADLQLWNDCISFDLFLEHLNQKYALNTILDASSGEGFKEVNQILNKDGSITLVMQRWT